jgi:hypothetical protein
LLLLELQLQILLLRQRLALHLQQILLALIELKLQLVDLRLGRADLRADRGIDEPLLRERRMGERQGEGEERHEFLHAPYMGERRCGCEHGSQRGAAGGVPSQRLRPLPAPIPISCVMTSAAIRFLAILGTVALTLAGCKPPPGGWGGYSNNSPYALPEYHGGYTPN